MMSFTAFNAAFVSSSFFDRFSWPARVGLCQGVMEGGLMYQTGNDANDTLAIGSLDAGLANFGQLTAYPSPVNTSADTKTYGASFVLFDNLWGRVEIPLRHARAHLGPHASAALV